MYMYVCVCILIRATIPDARWDASLYVDARNHRRKRAEAMLASFSQQSVVGTAGRGGEDGGGGGEGSSGGGGGGGGRSGGGAGAEGVGGGRAAERVGGEDGGEEGASEYGGKMMQEGLLLVQEDRAKVGRAGAGGTAANVGGLGGGWSIGERAKRRKELLRKEYDLLSFLRPGVA